MSDRFASRFPEDDSVRLPSTWCGPGLVDLQVNGYAGIDFNAPADSWTLEAFQTIRTHLRRRGVAVALPTFITDDPEALLDRARTYHRFLTLDPELESFFPRLHLEGPFISPEDGPRGAHPLKHCRDPIQQPDLIDRLREASGDRIGLVTLAPERPGAIDLIAQLSREGIRVGIGHTNADADTLKAAVDAGARLSVHLGNGSHMTLPRLDNYVQRQLSDDRLIASFIADGHHIPFPTLKNFLRSKTAKRSLLVTDAMAAADAPPGRFFLGGEEVIVTPDLRVSKPGQPNLAGSALTLDRAILNVVQFCDIDFPTAWMMASVQPASFLGIAVPDPVEVRIDVGGMQRLNSE